MRQSECVRRPSAALTFVLLVIAALLAGGATAGCSSTSEQKLVAGSGTLVTRQFDVSGFTAVSFDDNVTAAVMYADKPAAAVSLDDNTIEYVVVEVEGDTLHVGLDPANQYSGQTFRVTLGLPSLQALEVTGKSRVRVYGFATSDPLSLTLTAGSRVALSGTRGGDVTCDVSGGSGLGGDLSADALTGTVSGSSRVGVTGTVTTAKLEASGGSSLDLATLTISDLDVRLSGGSRGTVFVMRTLNADVSGGSQLDYSGSPTLGEVDSSGGSQINRTGD